jgi:hypothetical protein
MLLGSAPAATAKDEARSGGQNSLQSIALIVVAAAGLWLVGVAFLMALRPRYCLHLCEKMSANLERSNWRLHFGHPRALFGA